MQKLLILCALLIVCLLTSCSSIMSTPYVRVDISGISDSTKIKIVDLDTTLFGDVTLKVPRQLGEYEIKVYHDSDSTSYNLKSRLSNDFIFGNGFLLSPYSYGVDLFSPKKYTFNKQVEFFSEKSGGILSKTWDYGKRKTSGLRLILGQGNTIGIVNQKISSRSNLYNFGFGYEKYVSDEVSVNVDYIMVSDFSFLDSNTTMALLRLQTGFEVARFKVDIGAFTGFTSFESYDYTPVSNDDYVESYITTYVGSVISPSFRVNSGFLIGVIYYYNFLEFRDGRLVENRNSTLTVDLVFRRTIKRNKPTGPILTFPNKERKKLF